MRIPIMATLCAFAAAPFGAALAAAPAPPARLGLCAACHGADGHSQMPGVPNLAGQRLDYLRDALRQYRDGRRAVPVMRAAIGPLNDAELDALVAWYSEQPTAPRNPP